VDDVTVSSMNTDLNTIITQIPGWMDAEDLRIEPSGALP
jgi:hypothetical protein